jgi:hypothetical protein
MFPYSSRVLLLGFFSYIHFGSELLNISGVLSSDMYFVKYLDIVRGCSISLFSGYFLGIFSVGRKIRARRELSNLFQTNHFFFYAIGWFGVIIVFAYLNTIPVLPLLLVLTDSAAVGKARELATTAFPAYFLVSNFIDYYLPICGLWFYFANKFGWAAFFILTAVFCSLITGQKASIAYVSILFFCADSLRRAGINWRLWLFFSTLSLILLMTLGYLQNLHLLGAVRSESLLGILDGTVGRLFFAGPEAFLAYVRFFPSIHGHFGFSSPSKPVDQLVHAFFNPDAGGIGTLNTAFPALVYASLGENHLVWLVVFCVAFCWTVVDRFWLRLICRSYLTVLYPFFCLSALKVCITDFLTVVVPFILTAATCISFNFFGDLLKCNSTILNFKFKYDESAIILTSLLLLLYVLQGQTRAIVNLLLVIM